VACVLLCLAEFVGHFGLALGEDENWEDVLYFVLVFYRFLEL
jgi:hypothetical protein